MPSLAALAPASDSIEPAIAEITRRNCHAPACRSLVKLNQIFQIVLEGEATTMGIPYDLKPDQHRIEERRLHRILLDHPNEFGPMCSLLTSLDSSYGKPGARRGIDDEKFVGVVVIDLALRMDGNGPPSCLPKVLAAMPHTEVADIAIASAKIGCEHEPIARNPCSRLTR